MSQQGNSPSILPWALRIRLIYLSPHASSDSTTQATGSATRIHTSQQDLDGDLASYRIPRPRSYAKKASGTALREKQRDTCCLVCYCTGLTRGRQFGRPQTLESNKSTPSKHLAIKSLVHGLDSNINSSFEIDQALRSLSYGLLLVTSIDAFQSSSACSLF